MDPKLLVAVFGPGPSSSSESEEEEEEQVPERRGALDMALAAGIVQKADAGMRIPLCDQFRKIPPEAVIVLRRDGLEKHQQDAQAKALYNKKEFVLEVLKEINAGLGAVTNLASFMETYKQIAIDQMRKVDNTRLIPLGRDLYIMAGMMAGVLRADEEHRIHFKKVARFEMHNYHQEAETFLINEKTMEIDRRQTEKRKAADDEQALRKMMEEEEARREEEEMDERNEAEYNEMVEQRLFDMQKFYRLLQNGVPLEEAQAECKEDARQDRLKMNQLVEPVSSPPRSEMGDSEIELDMERIKLEDDLIVHAPSSPIEPFSFARCLAIIQQSERERGVRSLNDYDNDVEMAPVETSDEAELWRYEEERAARQPWAYTGDGNDHEKEERRRYEEERAARQPWAYTGDGIEHEEEERRIYEDRAARQPWAYTGDANDHEEEERRRYEEERAAHQSWVYTGEEEPERNEREQQYVPPHEGAVATRDSRSNEHWQQQYGPPDEGAMESHGEERQHWQQQYVPPDEAAVAPAEARRERQAEGQWEEGGSSEQTSTFVSPLDGPQPVPRPVLPSPMHRRPQSPSPAARAARTAAVPRAAAEVAPSAPAIASIFASPLDGPQPVPPPVLPSPLPRRPQSPSPAARTARVAAVPRAVAAAASPAPSIASTRPTDPRQSRSRTRDVMREVEVVEVVEEEPELMEVEQPSLPALPALSHFQSVGREDRGRADLQTELSDYEEEEIAPVYTEKYKHPIKLEDMQKMVVERATREERKMKRMTPKVTVEFNRSTHGASRDYVDIRQIERFREEYERAPRINLGIRPKPGTLKSIMKVKMLNVPVLLTDMIADKLIINPADKIMVKERENLVNLQKEYAMRVPDPKGKKKKVRFCAAEDPRNKMRVYNMSYALSAATMIVKDAELTCDPLDDRYDNYVIDAKLSDMKKLLEKTSQLNKENPPSKLDDPRAPLFKHNLCTLPYRSVTGSCAQQGKAKDHFYKYRTAPIAIPLSKGKDVIYTRASAQMRKVDERKEEYTELEVPHRDYKIIRAIKPMLDMQIENAWLPMLRLYLDEAFGCGLSRQLGTRAVSNAGLTHLVFTDSLLDRVNTVRFPQTFFAIHQQPMNLSSSFRVLCNEIPLEKLMNINWFIFAYGFDEILFQQQHPCKVAENVMHHVIAIEKLYFTALNLLRTRHREPLNIAQFRVFKLPLIGMDEKIKPWIRKFNARLDEFAVFFKSVASENKLETFLPMHFQILEWQTDEIVKETKKLGEKEAKEAGKGPYKYNCIDSFARAALFHCHMRTARKCRPDDTETFHLKRKQVDAPGLSKEDHDRIY